MSQLRLKVIATEALTPLVRSLTLAAEDDGPLPAYRAGAHIRVSLPGGDDRPYSLVNADSTPGITDKPEVYRLGVRLEEESKGGSAYMHGLREGDIIETTAPDNDFRLVDGSAPVTLIAGGIGATPIISMAAELKAAGRPFRFHYSARSRAHLAFGNEITAICGQALATYCDDEPENRINLKEIIVATEPNSEIYVCGPRGMIEGVRELALDAGFAKERIHFELFETPEHQDDDDSFEVEISSTGQVFTIPPDKSIIEVLEDEGVDLLYDCQRGDCGICQTTVVEGIPDHRDVILSEEERAANNVMQICVSRAKSARLVLDL